MFYLCYLYALERYIKGIMKQNPELSLAWQFIENTGTHLFLTGKAGTGKTTFLRRLKAESPKRMVVLAPTGIAAINAGGMTIHSFFQLPFAPYVPETSFSADGKAQYRFRFGKEKLNIIRSIDLLVIDEISMVRADLLDAIDDVLRRFRDRNKPFGGVQLLLIGDLQQLAPVVKDEEWLLLSRYYDTPYFFSSRALKQTEYCTIELKTVYRQSDTRFLDMLNRIRENRCDHALLEELNRRYIPDFKPAKEEGYIRLTTHNYQAQRINEYELALLPGRSFTFRAKIEGKFPDYSYPTDEVLVLKRNAQVMFVKNDSSGEHRYYNGMIGEVVNVSPSGIEVRSKGSDAAFVLQEEEWANAKYVLDEETKEIKEEIEGVFKQFPLKLAWAITIHKSQGLTFDRAIIDATSSFTHGQTYVALSRCRSLEGMVLERPIPPSAIINDPTVTQFMDMHTGRGIDNGTIETLSHRYYLHLAESMFNFKPVFSALEGVNRMLQENFLKLYPSKVQELMSGTEELQGSMIGIGERFIQQIRQIDARTPAGLSVNPQLTQRIKDASHYFLGHLRRLRELVSEIPTEHDNRKVSQKLAERMELFESMTGICDTLLETFAEEDFSIESYLEIKARGAFRTEQKKKKRRGQKESETEHTTDELHPELMERLREWRSAKARENGSPAYTVCTTRSLLAISNHLPQNYDELRMMPGIGATTVKRYGDELLDIVDSFMAEAGNLKMIPLPEKNEKKEKTDRQRKPQPSKGDSVRLSCEMFLSGKSIDEICADRTLKRGTVEGHLLEGLDLRDNTTVDRLVNNETRRHIEDYLTKTDTASMTLSEIREAIGGDIEWFELRVVAGHLNRLKQGCASTTD